MNLATIVEGHDADRPALISRGRVTNYGELREQVARMPRRPRRPRDRAG